MKTQSLLSKLLEFRNKFFSPQSESSEETGREGMLRMLSGTGIEIGALHRPCEAPHLNIKYVDRLTREELLEQYPELLNEHIVETDILDDAESLATLAEGSQDFVIANHVVEHMRDPIGAMLAWQRVLRVGGRLFLAAPDKHHTFDKDREITEIEHLLLDFQHPDPDRDRQHFEEFALYVSCKTFKVKPESEYLQFASELQKKEYSIHYHVWDYPSFSAFIMMLQSQFPQFSLKRIASMPTTSDEFIFILEKKR